MEVALRERGVAQTPDFWGLNELLDSIEMKGVFFSADCWKIYLYAYSKIPSGLLHVVLYFGWLQKVSNVAKTCS